MTTRCIFCRILAGELPASVVYRDELCWAFMDLRPIRPGHVLVVPTRHAEQLHELDDAARAHLWEIGQRIADAHRDALGSPGHNFLLNDGRAANQTVTHAHLHVIPRTGRDFIRAFFGLIQNLTGLGRVDRPALDAAAEALSEALEAQEATVTKEAGG